jgi:hypothetical protein
MMVKTLNKKAMKQIKILIIMMVIANYCIAQTSTRLLTFTYNGKGGQEATRTVSITGFEIKTHPQSQVVCIGSKLILSVSAIGQNLTYEWYKGSTKVGTNLNSYTIASVTSADAADYKCIVTSGSQSKISNTAKISTQTAPTISTQPQAQYVCEGSSVMFNCLATSTNLSYNWYKSGSGTVLATGTVYSIANTSQAQTGNYYCTVSNTCGTATSTLVNLTVYASTVAGSLSGPDHVYCNQTIYLTLDGNVGSPSYYVKTPSSGGEWYETGSSYDPSGVDGTYSFKAVIQNGYCNSEESNSIDVNVYPGATYAMRKSVQTTKTSEVMAAHPSAKEIKSPNISEGLVVSPNPNTGNFSVNFGANETGEGLLSIKDASGRPVIVQKFAKESFGYSESFSLEGLKPGFYFVEIVLADKRETAKFVVVE